MRLATGSVVATGAPRPWARTSPGTTDPAAVPPAPSTVVLPSYLQMLPLTYSVTVPDTNKAKSLVIGSFGDAEHISGR